MVICRNCKSKNTKRFFFKESTPFWYGKMNSELNTNIKNCILPAEIYLCFECGFIFVPLSPKLQENFKFIYQSEQSDPGETYDDHGYGLRLTKQYFNDYHKVCGDYLPESLLEIGCQRGYILNEFQKRGVNNVLGIEPGNVAAYHKNIPIKRGLFSRALLKNNKYEMVINSAVLEHIEDPNKFLSDINFCLTSKGKLFIAVPNEKYALLNGNVGMFVHVHINYITPEIITGLLLNNGFKVLSVLDKPDQPLYIFAEKIGLPSKTFNWSNILTSSIKYCAVYQDKVEENIQKFSHISREIGKTIIGLYGATFETANLISWARSGIKNIDFIVFDSDMRKVGSAYSGIPGIVKAPDDLNQVEDIIITPFRYQNDIYDYAQPYLKGNTKLYKLYN